MKRVKRERKVKRARRKSGQKKRNLHVKKVTNKSGRKIFIKKEIPEQVQVKEKPKTTEKKNLWIYVLVLIIIIILILLTVKFIPVLKTPENPPKPSSIIPLPTAAVTQQVIQEKIVSEKTETPAQEKETKIIIYFPLNEWDVKNLFAGEKDKLNALIDNFLKDKT
ncbi:MAG: hypothetical protein KA120_00425 [Candidatus Goldbacteria bacterium]|nr:hypothetical protein [Candidatus Goldiibacteriota bacterium]